MEHIWILGYLGINAWKDIRKKEIFLPLVILFSIVGWIRYFLEKNWSLQILLSLGVGLFFLGFSIWTKGGMGMGDCLLIFSMIPFLEMEEFLSFLVLGMFLAALWSLFQMVCFHKKRNDEIPLVPFLVAGYLWGCLIW